MGKGLEDQEIEQALRELPGWRHDGKELVKWFRFGGFPEAIAFLQRIVEPAERLNHHPDIEAHHDRVRIALHTWNEDAITDKDLSLAREIERLVSP